MLSYRFRGLRLSENGDGFHGPIAVYIICNGSGFGNAVAGCRQVPVQQRNGE